MIRLLVLMVSMMMTAGTSLAENISPCPAGAVQIQIISGAEYGSITTLSAASVDGIPNSPPGFTAFVTAVTEHIEAKMAQENLCLDSTASRKGSLLQFVALPVEILNGQSPVSMPSLKSRATGGCRISSPWIDLVIEREPVPKVRGIVRFSARQLLTDQAILAGARDVPPGLPLPLKDGEFGKYVLEYRSSKSYSHTSQRASKPIEELVPPDLRWLFRRSRGRDSGGTVIAMKTAMETSAGGYTKIVIALIDHCLASGEADTQYSSVLDIVDLVPLEQYKIVTPID